jgi:hypothetical protein
MKPFRFIEKSPNLLNFSQAAPKVHAMQDRFGKLRALPSSGTKALIFET